VKKSRVPLRFKKGSYFPILKDIKPTQKIEKVYLGGSKPLILTASLDHEIYTLGQPIQVRFNFYISITISTPISFYNFLIFLFSKNNKIIVLKLRINHIMMFMGLDFQQNNLLQQEFVEIKRNVKVKLQH